MPSTKALTATACLLLPFVLLLLRTRKMSKIAKLKQFFKVTHALKPTGFGSLLRITPSFPPPTAKDTTISKYDRTLVTKYTVPEHLCLNKSGTQSPTKGLPLSVLMSLFDDVSTWPCIAEDKQMRPGVSVHLSAELTSPTSPIKPDTDLLITARPLKIGRTLAFLSLECRDANTDQLYATGRHTKYLPMGFIFETAFTHFMPLLELYAKVANPFGKQNHDLENRTTFPNIKDVVGDINAVKGVAEVKVNKQHLNPMGGLHGGCQSVLAELVGTQTLQEQYSDHTPYLRSMSVAYLSTGKGVLNVKADVVNVENDIAKVTVQLDRQKGGAVVADCDFKFDLVKK